MCFIYYVKWWTFIAYKTVVCADLEGNQGGPYTPPPAKFTKNYTLNPSPPMPNANNCRNPWIRAWVDVSIYHWVRSCKLVSVFKRRWLFWAWVFLLYQFRIGIGHKFCQIVLSLFKHMIQYNYCMITQHMEVSEMQGRLNYN